MKSHSEVVEVAAPATDVWNALTHLAGYARWNRTIPRAQGVIATGERLSLWLELGNESRAFDPQVVEVRAEHLLVLQKILLHRALLRATHAFRLESCGDGCTRLTQEWQLGGLLAPVVWPRFRLGFPAFARMGRDLAGEVARTLPRTPRS